MTNSAKKRVLPKKTKSLPRVRLNWWIILAFVMLYFIGNVWQSVNITRLNRQNELLRNELESLEHEYNLLVYTYEQKRDPEQILKRLKNHVKLEPAEILNIDDNAVLGD